MSILSSYVFRNKHKYVLDKNENEIYILSISNKRILDFKICLKSNICRMASSKTKIEFPVTSEDLEQLKELATI